MCDTGYTEFEGSCYRYDPTELYGVPAQTQCAMENANLVSIHSLEEENYVRSIVT